MTKIKCIFVGAVIVLLVAGGWFGYLKMNDDTYKGMSIIPEQHDDIPLFKGLEPTDSHYVIDGDHWKEIYDFYFKKLPKLGWENQYVQSALDDNDPENDWGGFDSRWTKKGFEGELSIYASYDKSDQQTKVIFDQNPIYHSSIWIDKVPESICIYKNSTDPDCTVLKDKSKIQKIVGIINNAIDWNEKALPLEKESTIDFGEINIKVIYEKEKEIYFKSEKGVKYLKPEPEFFKLTNLSQ
ncbi:hypothetical protein FB550_11364 [Neobacillus bataviensis]|uniref:Uncharacterized protein n=1 Tax=Neobacillus bataviensis TaxID=220685 RepID=A0A561CTI1_9BACI|nr:hypothetical protein [Neobacillus bataviensis]TWD94531.1 hypothetical protein FB550_11364 [Neobacillus bataviensis]